MKQVSLSFRRFEGAVRSRNFWVIAALLAGISFLHYFSLQVRSVPLFPYSLGRHAVERIAFLLPVAVAAFAFGQSGGAITLAVALAMMLPRAILISPSPADAVLETVAIAIVGYFVVWAIGTLAREKRLRQGLSQRLERAYNRLQTLYENAQSVSSTLDLQSVLDELVRATARAMDVQACSILLLDETRMRLYVRAAFGLSDAYMQKGPLVLKHNPLAREVLAGSTIAIGDLAKDGRLQYPAAALAEGIRSMLSAPLVGKDEPLGLIRAYSTELNHFTEDDATFLRAIASQGSIAIGNAMAYQALGQLEQMKSRFVLTVTHELRSPVSVVRSLLRTLSAGYAGTVAQSQRDLITRALRRADFLQTLIDDLLDLAHGKSELGMTEERADVLLSEAIDDVVKRFKVPAEEKQIELEWQCGGSDRPIMVSATKEGVDRILNNLVSNAIKYTLPGGHVSVRLLRDNGNAHLEVADSGIGIPEEALPHLFEEFYRARNAKALEKEGTGLGLAITRDLVVRYGGRIDVRSKVGEGTTFSVFLPIVGRGFSSTTSI